VAQDERLAAQYFVPEFFIRHLGLTALREKRLRRVRESEVQTEVWS
jgi:hypothetical protein